MARAIWSGSISFGLVNIPVKLFAALRDRDVRFHLMSSDGKCRLHRKLVCNETGKEYDFNETTRGFEIAPGQYVLVTDEELDQLRPETGRSIDISDFVDLDEIDPVLFDRPYYLVPEKNGSKPYRLLLEALRDANKVAICRFVMRTKEYLGALRPIGDALCIETMRFADEVVPVDEIGALPSDVRVSAKELEMADQIIESLTTSFKADSYRDEYRVSVQELVERKAEGETVVTHATTKTPRGKVIDLMEALRQSLAEVKADSGTKKSGSGTKKAPARKPKRSSSSSKRSQSRTTRKRAA